LAKTFSNHSSFGIIFGHQCLIVSIALRTIFIIQTPTPTPPHTSKESYFGGNLIDTYGPEWCAVGHYQFAGNLFLRFTCRIPWDPKNRLQDHCGRSFATHFRPLTCYSAQHIDTSTWHSGHPHGSGF